MVIRFPVQLTNRPCLSCATALSVRRYGSHPGISIAKNRFRGLGMVGDYIEDYCTVNLQDSSIECE